MNRFRFVVAAWLAVFFLTTVVQPAEAATPPSWQCVPPETMFTARVPNLAAFVEAFKSRTKLGAVLTADQRVADFKALLKGEAEEDWDVVAGTLEKLGLEPDDLWRAAEGEIGYAGTLARNAGEPEHCYFGLAWLECDDELQKKWLAALDRRLEDEPETTPGLRRQDVDLGGSQVIHLTLPTWRDKIVAVDAAKPTLPTVKGADDPKTPDSKAKKVPQVEVEQTHLLVHRLRDRLVFGHTHVVLLDTDDRPLKPEQYGRVEVLRETFARFIEAHRSGGDEAVRAWHETPGLADAMPEGEPLVDVLVNVHGLVALLNTPETDDAWRFVQGSGFEKIGPLAYRATLDGTVFRSGLFLGVPAPRQGLATLLDQTPIKPEPADWVANTAVGYQQISFDLGKAYKIVSRIMRSDLPRGEGMLNTLETQCRAFLQVEPQALFDAFGKTHTILTYLPKVEPEAALRRVGKDDPSAQTAMAFVWTGIDEALWKRLMQMLSTATSRQILAEQGFSGLRYEESTMSGGWFLGNGYMVVAVGKGVTEKALANLRSTPRGTESLRGSPHAKRAAELLPQTGALTYDLTDGAGLLQFTDAVMKRAFADTKDADAAKLKKLWPTDEEWRGTIGVSVSATTVDNKGVTYRSALELPAP